MNVPRNFLETIPRSLPPSCPSAFSACVVNSTVFCAVLCNFTADSNIPRLNLVLVTPRRISPVYFGSTCYRTPRSLHSPFLFVALYPLAPASSVRAFCSRLLRDVTHPLVPSKTTCGNLVASSDHKGPPGRKYLNSNTFLLRGSTRSREQTLVLTCNKA